MKSVRVTDLRNNFALVSKSIQAGEPVAITKRGRPFATLLPVPAKKETPPPVDLMARLRSIFPNGPVTGDVRDIIDYDRGGR